jgi:glycosyltransferase involved in cell wall biosynthesis
VVVHRSTDEESIACLRSLNGNHPGITCVAVDVPGQVAALNAGLAGVTNDVVAITDDDAAPHVDWLARIEAHYLENSDVGAVGGRDCVAHEAGAPRKDRVGIVFWYGRRIGNHHAGIGPARSVDVLKGANMSYRLRAIAGIRFDTRLRGEGAQPHNDLSFSLAVRRAGWKVIYDPAVAVDHFPAPRFDDDQRGARLLPALTNDAHNEALAILEHLEPAGRLFFWLWYAGIGTRKLPGLLQCARLGFRRPAIWSELWPILRARIQASKLAQRRSTVRKA